VPRKEITGTPTFRCLCQNRTDDPISSCRCILFAQRSVRPTREHVPLGLAVMFPPCPISQFSLYLPRSINLGIIQGKQTFCAFETNASKTV